MEQVAAVDAGRILAVARAHQQPPAVVHGGGKIAGRGVRAAAADHGHKGYGVAAGGGVHGVDGDGPARVVDGQQVGVPLLGGQGHAVGGKLLFQRRQHLLGVVVPDGGVFDHRCGAGRVVMGSCHGGHHGRLRRGGRGGGGAVLRCGGGQGALQRGLVLGGIGHLHTGAQQAQAEQQRQDTA